MALAYSQDLRDRLIDAVIGGKMSRRGAAARFGVSLSSAIKWVQRFERTGSRKAARMGGYKAVIEGDGAPIRSALISRACCFSTKPGPRPT